MAETTAAPPDAADAPATPHAAGVSLEALLAAYEASVTALTRAVRPTPASVLETLLAREALARSLTADPQPPFAIARATLALDQRLQGLRGAIVNSLGGAQLKAFRETLNAPAQHWWWRLDERPSGLQAVLAPLASLALLLALAISLLSVLQISRAGVNVADFSAIAGLLLTLVSGSTLTGRARELVVDLLNAARIPLAVQPLVRLLLALVVLFAAVRFYVGLPEQAVQLNNEAVALQQRGALAAAIDRYEQALRLNPSYAEAYYNLGTAYEAAVRYDDAIEAYKQAYRLDQNADALNNLGHLYLAELDNPRAALRLLDEPIRALGSPADATRAVGSQTLYALFKNRAWALLRLGLLGEAADDLQRALALRPDGSAAHCLLAQLAEHPEHPRPDPIAARESWSRCLAFGATDYNPPEPEWMAMARERLR